MVDLPNDSLLSSPKLVAIAHDSVIKPVVKFEDKANLPGVTLDFGQDITSGLGRKAPQGESVGTTQAELKPKMRKLLDSFAAGDKTGMAKRLFDAFLDDKPRQIMFFDDADLSAAAAKHKNILAFMSAALSAPNSPHKADAGKVRIHQALKAAGWDISKLIAPADLGVPAFNDGNKTLSTGDFNNGLGLMINGVQHAFALATHYKYDKKSGTYIIGLRFLFYDVFGLDDKDLADFGDADDAWYRLAAPVGITAWWQLQHQFGHVPLITRIILEQALECPAT